MEILARAASPLFHGFIASALMFTVLWLIQRARKNAGVVDVGWTAGVGAMAVYLAATGGGWLPRRLLLAVLAGFWSFRLVLYILLDRVIGRPEDGRYQRMRAYWGAKADFYFYFFFVSQSLLVVLFALPFLPVVGDARGLRIWDVLGVVLWFIAVGGETLADRQLARFRGDPENRGKTCRAGLWGWSRHPNYFFEWLHWWVYVLIGAGAAGGWLTLVGPVTMFAFLMRITGIPYVEKQALASRADDYREYQRTVSMFIPWPPRRRKD